MKIQITKKVTDRITKEQHLPGDEVEKSEDRAKEFIKKNVAIALEFNETPKEVLQNQEGKEIPENEEAPSKNPEKKDIQEDQPKEESPAEEVKAEEPKAETKAPAKEAKPSKAKAPAKEDKPSKAKGRGKKK